MEYQNTINKEFRLTGPGLHTGRTVTVTIKPAPENFGIAFRRTDRVNIITQQAVAERVGETSRGTTLGSGRHTIATIEHLMSALHGMKVDNVLIELDGGEVPILDGSSRPWLLQLVRVGVRQQQAERKVLAIREPLHFEFAPTGSVFDVEPCDHFAVHCEIDFKDTVIGHQQADMNDFSEYAASIAPCRTFVFFHEIEFLFKNNLVKGGDVDNAIVIVEHPVEPGQVERLSDLFNVPRLAIDDKGYLNNLQLHFPDECGRHKLLDIIGDLALSGGILKARVTAFKPGHSINTRMARAIREAIYNKS